MSYYTQSSSSYSPSAEYEHERLDEYKRLQQRVYYRNKKFKDEVKWHPSWTQEELLARQYEHAAYIKEYVAGQEKFIKERLESLKRAHERYWQQNMHDGTYTHGFESKSSEYLHQEFLEDRRLKERIRYRNSKFKEEVARHPEWSPQELLKRTHAHEEFISDYTAKEKRDIKHRLKVFEEDEMRRAKEETRKRAEDTFRDERAGQGWYQQQQQQEEDAKRRDEKAYARQQWYNCFDGDKKYYESQQSRREDDTRRRAQDRAQDNRRQTFENERQRKEKESKERQQKQAEERERLKELRYKSYEDGWSSGAAWKTKTNILFNDIPWPTLHHPQSADAVTSEAVTAFFNDPKYLAPAHWISRKKRLRTELLRWHSDKFQAVLKNVAYSDQLVVHVAAEVVVRALNELKG
ncbi:uncharacterized protein EV420DRAFT_1521925 [Desarmillaria tabescens]|uniref:Uncharacterized protein n=1 Tax=Armillaria tabescens TaxID=1929756 RepID=A0AA39NC67_ARMTA|nr:uncharacterized protein EV420DRAFT_1521925 [Desarmillaria tabescens]KAK0462961.1 hypothetical protein EV420DRAFT_1521925 [Desarmillaria tabescens]